MSTIQKPAKKPPKPKRAPLRTWEDEGREDVDLNELPFGGRFGPPQPRDPIPGQPPLLPEEQR
jgi:hypothetical protein